MTTAATASIMCMRIASSSFSRCGCKRALVGKRAFFPDLVSCTQWKPFSSAADASQQSVELSPHAHAIYEKMIALSEDDVALVSEVISERLGLPIPDFSAPAAVQQQEEEAEVDVVVEAEKTLFDLKLVGFDAKAKIKVIKEVRAIAGLGLKEAKELVEGAPKVVKKDIKKEEAEELQKKLEEVGATIEVS